MEASTDPIAQLSDWLAQAVAQEGFNHDAMALATAAQVPDVRYVLLKRVSGEGLEFYTNRSSSKCQQLMANQHAAASLYWPGLGRQVRARGPVAELSRERVKEYFATRGRKSQLGAWASHQSSTLDKQDTLKARFREAEERFEGKDVDLPEFWTGYCLRPLAIEFWQEGANRLHERILHERDDLASPWKNRLLYP